MLVSYICKAFLIILGSGLGTFVGIMCGSYNVAQLLSSISWGKLSDLAGRVPVMKLGCIINILCILLFGLYDIPV